MKPVILALLLTSPAIAQLTAYPNAGVVVNNPTAVVFLQESGISGTPVVTVSGGTGVSIVSQSVTNNVFSVANGFTVVLNTGSATGNLTFTDTTSHATGTVIVRNPQTWYVRSDGGTSANLAVPAGQCDGLADAPYPGTGTNQHCAYNDILYLYATGAFCNDPTGGSTCWRWVIAGGDTAMVRDSIQYSATTPFAAIPGSSGRSATGSFGPGASDWSFSLAGDNNLGGMPAPPNGWSAQHTKVMGYNHAACSAQSARAGLDGRYDVGEVIQMEGTSYVDLACFDISDRSSCDLSTSINQCSTSPPYTNFAKEGIGINNSTVNTTFTDIRVHGLAAVGVYGPTGDGVVMTRVDLIGNAGAGWNADKGDGQTGTGSALMQNFEISWNGCAEEYPLVDALPYIDCRGQSSGGYGDGFGTATVSAPPPGWQMHFDQGLVTYNIQDGLDALHLIGGGSSMTITRTLAFGNGGQQLKNGGAAGFTVNNTAVGNCLALLQQQAGNQPLTTYGTTSYVVTQPGGAGTPSTLTLSGVTGTPTLQVGQIVELTGYTSFTRANFVAFLITSVGSGTISAMGVNDTFIVSPASGTETATMTAGWNVALSSDLCRASDVAIVQTVSNGNTATFEFNTVYSANHTIVELDCDGSNGPCDSTALINWRNNLFIGFENDVANGYIPPFGTTGDFANPIFNGSVFDGFANPLQNSGSIYDHNLILNPHSGWTSPQPGETNPICCSTDPGLVDETYHLVGSGNMAPSALTSFVVNRVPNISGITSDFFGNTRPQPPSTISAEGAIEFGPSGSVVTHRMGGNSRKANKVVIR